MFSKHIRSMENSLWNIEPADSDSALALDFLHNPDNLSSFSEGLTSFLSEHSYQGSLEDIEKKTDFLYDKLSQIDVPITKSTIRDWFSQKHRPGLAANSRTTMYQICFALSATLEEVKKFFHLVYLDRSFNCHTVREAVYYFCFLNQLPYAKANELAQVIDGYPALPKAGHSAPVFTRDITNFLNRCHSEEDFLSFFQKNKNIFEEWNISARTYISKYLDAIRGKPEDRAVINRWKKGKVITDSEKRKCGLVIQELLESQSKSPADISGKNIASIDFMLDCILYTPNGISKASSMPGSLKINFPNRKTLSDIFTKAEHSTSYDSIRKCLIMLKFYHFWRTFPEQNFSPAETFDIYVEETNNLLYSCCYEDLNVCNPYDWLFLWASKTEDPLGYLRDAVNQEAGRE